MAWRSRAAASSSAYRSIGTAYRARNVCAEAEHARVEEVQDGPQLGQPVLHRRAGQRDPAAGPGTGAPPGPSSLALFLMCCASSSTTRSHAHRGQRVGVAGGGRVGGQHARRRRRAARPVGPVGAVQHAHPQRRREPGGLALPVARAPTAGRSAASGRTAACSSSASSCTVLPSPMSSARQAPRPSRSRKASQEKPRRWYGRSSPAQRRPARRAARAARPGHRRAGRRASPCRRSRSPAAAAPRAAAAGSCRSASPAVIVPPPRRRNAQPGGEPLRVQVDPAPAQPDQRHLDPGQVGRARPRSAPGRRAPAPTGSRRCDARSAVSSRSTGAIGSRGAHLQGRGRGSAGSRHQAGSRTP